MTRIDAPSVIAHVARQLFLPQASAAGDDGNSMRAFCYVFAVLPKVDRPVTPVTFAHHLPDPDPAWRPTKESG